MLGFDIGSHELKIASWRGSKLTQCVSAEMPEGIMENGVIVQFNNLAGFIRETIKKNRISGGSAALILPSEMVYTRRSVMPYMSDDKMRVNLPFEFRDYLNADKNAYYYAYHVNSIIRAEDGKTPREMDITASAVLKETINRFRSMFKRAGLTLKIAVPYEIAFAQLIQMHGDYTEKEFCFLNLGHSVTRLDFYNENIYEASRTIEKGLAAVDEAIAEKLDLDLDTANTYKESNKDDVQNSEEALNVYNRLTSDVRKALNFYGLNHRNSTLADVWVTGGGGLISTFMDQLRDTLTEFTFHPASDLFPKGFTDDPMKTPFAGALGAAMCKEYNLVQKEKSGINPLIAIPLILLIAGGGYLLSRFGVIGRFDKLADTQKELAVLQDREREFQASVADFDEVKKEFLKYAVSWMTDEEKNLIPRSDILNLLEREILSKSRIIRMESSGNVVTCKVAGITLDDASRIVDSLYTNSNVVNVMVTSAASEDFTVKIVDEEGKETEEKRTESVVLFTITLAKDIEE